MNKKAFTLVELMATLIILSAIALISVPAVLKSIENSRTNAYNSSITNIKIAMQNWKNDHADILPKTGDKIYLTISLLKHEGYLPQKMLNPLNSRSFPNDMLVNIENSTTGYKYNVDLTSGHEVDEYDFITPYIEFNNTDIKRTIYVGDTYESLTAIAYNGEGLVTTNSVTTEVIGGGSVSTASTGSYYILYKATVSDIPVAIVENLVIEPKDAVCRVVTQATPGSFTVGDKYTCDPGDGISRVFYILSVQSNDLIMIMEKNIGTNVQWGVTEADQALAYVQMATREWKNVTVSIPDANMVANASGYSAIQTATTSNLSGWLYANLRCSINTCTEEINELDSGTTNGYWTSTKAEDYNAYGVDGNGKIVSYSSIANNYYGIRPTITVSKDKVIN